MLEAWRETLYLTPRSILQQRIFSSTRLERAEVIEIRWPAFPRGRALVIRSHVRQICLHLGNFTRADAAAVVADLGNAHPPSIQKGYEMFEKWFLPAGRAAVAKGNNGRRRWPMALFFAAVAVLSLALALSGRRPQSFYPLALMNAGAAVWLMSSARRPKADAARAGQRDGDGPAP